MLCDTEIFKSASLNSKLTLVHFQLFWRFMSSRSVDQVRYQEIDIYLGIKVYKREHQYLQLWFFTCYLQVYLISTGYHKL